MGDTTKKEVESIQMKTIFNGKEIVKQTLEGDFRPLPKPKPQQEMEEEKYVQGLEFIIKRDFFPDLEKLQVQKELHDAVDEMDDVKAAKLAMKLAELDDDHVANPTLKDLEYDTSLNLDKFQSKYTSEDNASFNQLVQVENEKKREKYSHFYPSKEKMLEIVDKKMIEGVSKPVNTWNHTPRSALMYGPEGAEMTMADLPSTRSNPKQVVHSSTRLPVHLLSSATAAPEKAVELQKVHAQKVWTDMARATPALFPNASGSNNIPLGQKTLVVGREATPVINGYKIIPDTPDIRPDDDIDPSELITWGMIESTPLLVDSGKGPSFSIAPTPKRDVLAKELGEKAGISMKKRSAALQGGTSRGGRPPTGGKTPLLHTCIGGGGVFKKPLARNQSPALMMLKKKLGAGAGNGLGTALQRSYSSTPKSSTAAATPSRTWTGAHKSVPTPSSSFQVMTPLHQAGTSSSSRQRPGDGEEKKVVDRKSLTDDLLNM